MQMLLYNKNKIVVKHKTKDIFYSVTWKHDKNNYHVVIGRYVNGYLSSGYTREYNLDSLDMIENKLKTFLHLNDYIIKSY